MTALLLLLCCSSADPDTAALEAEGPYLADADSTTPPTLDAVALSATVTEALLAVRSRSPGAVLDAYAALMAGADDTCPSWSTYEGAPLWFDTCTASSGVAFDGYGLSAIWTDYADETGNTWTGEQLYSVGTITASDGALTTGGGLVLLTGTGPEGESLHYAAIDPGFSWSGTATGTWLDEVVSEPLYWLSSRDPVTGGAVIQIGGTVVLESGELGGDTVVFDSITLIEAALGAACAIEPSGGMSVLDADGRWIDLLFDGSSDVTAPATSACDGCATAWYRGVALGQVCVDFGYLTDWSESPWI